MSSLIGLGGLDRPDRRAQDAEHAALGAARDHAGGRRLGVEAAVAGRLAAGRRRPEDARLAVEAVDRAPHVRLAEEERGVVDHVAGREVVRAVDDEVVLREDLHHVRRVEPLLVQHDVDQRVDLAHRVAGALGLGPVDVALAVDDLALQVALVDDVEVDDAQRPDAGRRQVHQGRRAQAAGTDGEHACVLQPLLPVHGDVGDDQVTAVAHHLLAGQLGGRLDQRRQRHGSS